MEGDRATSSVLLELGELKLVYDFGRGISQRLASLGLIQNDIKHVIISHFHPDHFSDLIPYLQAASWSRIDPRTTNLSIYGPRGTKNLIKKISDLLGEQKQNFRRYKPIVCEVDNGKINIENLQFSFVKLPPANNHGIKFTFNNKTVAITGDSEFHQKEVDFLKNTDVAIIDSGHIEDEEIVRLSVLSQAKQIVCSHLYRNLDENELNNRASAAGYHGRVIIGEDLASFVL